MYKATGHAVRSAVLATLSVMMFTSCDLANDGGGPGDPPPNPGGPLPTLQGIPGLVRASFKGIQPQSNGGSSEPQLSADGRYVAFYSWASNLVAGDTNFCYDVFVRDRDTNGNGIFDEPGEGTTIRVSVASDGTQGTSDSYMPKISGDGRFVTFISYATEFDSVTPDTNGASDIFVHDRDTDNDSVFDEVGNTSTLRVNKWWDAGATAWVESNDYSDYPDISDDGRFVTFYSYANNLLGPGGDTNFISDVFVVDRDLNDNDDYEEDGDAAITRISVDPLGNEADSDSYNSVISGDGSTVVFYSYASNLVPSDTNGTSDIFVRNLGAGTTTRVSVASDGTQGNQFSFLYGNVVSQDGRYVTFTSFANNLVPGDTNSTYDVFWHDRNTATTLRASVASDGSQGNSTSYYGSVSDDGDFVVFMSFASTLIPNDTNSQWDTYVHSMSTGATARMSISSTGGQGNGSCYFATISGDGRMVAFYGNANNLILQDTNGFEDCFVRDRDTDVDGIFDEVGAVNTLRVSEVASTEPAGDSSAPAISGDGNLIAFESFATDVVASDNNGLQDVFVRDVTLEANGRASITNVGAEASGGFSLNPSISSDGRSVAFESDANNLVPSDTNATRDIFVRTLSGTVRVSVMPTGAQSDGFSANASISGDGSIVAFDSFAENLDGSDGAGIDIDGFTDIYVRNLSLSTTLLVSRQSITIGGAKGDSHSSFPSVSANGQFVAFQSTATNLMGPGGDTNLVSDIYVRDLVNNRTVRVSVTTAGGQATGGGSRNASISGDGRFVVFESDATNLDSLQADSNAQTDIFVHDRDTDQNGIFDEPGLISTVRINLSPAGAQATLGASTRPVISEDGAFVAYQSAATNLTANDTNPDVGGPYVDVFRTSLTGTTFTTVLVSESSSGTGGTGHSTSPSISADGSFVAFQSTAKDLVSPPEGAVFIDVYRRGPF